MLSLTDFTLFTYYLILSTRKLVKFILWHFFHMVLMTIKVWQTKQFWFWNLWSQRKTSITHWMFISFSRSTSYMLSLNINFSQLWYCRTPKALVIYSVLKYSFPLTTGVQDWGSDYKDPTKLPGHSEIIFQNPATHLHLSGPEKSILFLYILFSKALTVLN